MIHQAAADGTCSGCGANARDFSQTVARAREHLTKRHQLDLAQRDEEIAIAAESPSQGQTPRRLKTSSNAAATETVNSEDTPPELARMLAGRSEFADLADRVVAAPHPEDQPELNDVLRQLEHDSMRELVEEIAGKAGIRRPSSLQLALVYDTVAKVAAAGRDRAARAALNSNATGAELARALGVSRQAVHKKYAS